MHSCDLALSPPPVVKEKSVFCTYLGRTGPQNKPHCRGKLLPKSEVCSPPGPLCWYLISTLPESPFLERGCRAGWHPGLFLLSDQGYTAKPPLPALQPQMDSAWGQDRHHHISWGSLQHVHSSPLTQRDPGILVFGSPGIRGKHCKILLCLDLPCLDLLCPTLPVTSTPAQI